VCGLSSYAPLEDDDAAGSLIVSGGKNRGVEVCSIMSMVISIG